MYVRKLSDRLSTVQCKIGFVRKGQRYAISL